MLCCGGPSVCEAACLLGTIPAVLPLVDTQFPQNTRLEAATFAHTMCTCSPLTLQIFISCSGLPALVTLLLNPSLKGGPYSHHGGSNS